MIGSTSNLRNMCKNTSFNHHFRKWFCFTYFQEVIVSEKYDLGSCCFGEMLCLWGIVVLESVYVIPIKLLLHLGVAMRQQQPHTRRTLLPAILRRLYYSVWCFSFKLSLLISFAWAVNHFLDYFLSWAEPLKMMDNRLPITVSNYFCHRNIESEAI